MTTTNHRSRMYATMFDLIRKGGITVGEARTELNSFSGSLWDADTAALVAGWVINSAHLGDDYYAGKNVH